MKIKGSNDNLLKQLFTKIGKKKILVIVLLGIMIAGFGFASLLYGAYLNKTGQTILLKTFFTRIMALDFSFTSNYLKGVKTDIDNFSIDIKFENWQKISYNREKALLNGFISSEMQEAVPANIRYNNNNYNVNLSLTGRWSDHYKNPTKWSLSVKVKDNKTIMGMKEFSLLVPSSRGYLTDWIATKILKSQNIIGLRSNFVSVNINGKENGLYYLEERFGKLLIENNGFREGIVFKLIDSNIIDDIEFNGLGIYELKKINKNKELSEQLIKLKKLIHAFLSGDISADKIFDLKKMATLYVVSDILNEKHALFPNNMRLYFNPITSLIEPIGREWLYLRKETQTHETSLSIEKPNPRDGSFVYLSNISILKRIYNSFAFEEEYIKQAYILSNPEYLDSLVDKNRNEIELLLKKIYKENPFYIFPLDLLHKNQKYIRDKINTELPSINVFYNHIQGDTVFLAIENKLDLPIEIHKYIYNSKIEIFPTDRTIVKSKYKANNVNQYINFSLPPDINIDEFNSDFLEVYYSILGINKIKKTIVYQKEMTNNNFSDLNPTTKKTNLNDFNFLIVNSKDRSIEFPGIKCDIQEDLIIPKGFIVTAKPGCQINLTNYSRIISYSPLLFFGKSDSLITIISTDSTGQGIVVFNCNRFSELSYVHFENLSNISDFGWSLTGAITFYESPVNIDNCNFSHNFEGDDFLNIVRTDFNILNTKFVNIIADAFDSDFCTGKMENVIFLNAGNDGIDISGTKLSIRNVFMDNIGDKGLSAGESSQIVANNIKISNSEIAVCSKDLSNIIISDVNLQNNKIGFTAFQKKTEFGSGIINVSEVEMKDVSIPYLIEKSSSCIVDGEIKKSNNIKVKDILYGVKYGRSSK